MGSKTSTVPSSCTSRKVSSCECSRLSIWCHPTLRSTILSSGNTAIVATTMRWTTSNSSKMLIALKTCSHSIWTKNQRLKRPSALVLLPFRLAHISKRQHRKSMSSTTDSSNKESIFSVTHLMSRIDSELLWSWRELELRNSSGTLTSWGKEELHELNSNQYSPAWTLHTQMMSSKR